MSTLKLTLPSGESLKNGKLITFRTPCNCNVIDMLEINGVAFDLVDAIGTPVSTVDGAFAEDAMISLALDVENSKAYIQGTSVSGVGYSKVDVANGAIQTIGEINKSKPVHIWLGTQAEYDALETKDAYTLYYITDESTLDDILSGVTPVGRAKAMRTVAVGDIDTLTDAAFDFQGQAIVIDFFKEIVVKDVDGYIIASIEACSTGIMVVEDSSQPHASLYVACPRGYTYHLTCYDSEWTSAMVSQAEYCDNAQYAEECYHADLADVVSTTADTAENVTYIYEPGIYVVNLICETFKDGYDPYSTTVTIFINDISATQEVYFKYSDAKDGSYDCWLHYHGGMRDETGETYGQLYVEGTASWTLNVACISKPV